MQMTHAPDSSLELVFKIQETCNINCTYCYMYNLGNEAYRLVPQKQAIDQTWLDVADFIIGEHAVRLPAYTRLILHGGEPMLVKPHVFRRRIEAFWARLESSLSSEQLSRVQFSIQTNGMLVCEDWKQILKQWRINVGVSIDGPQEVHDKRRLDKHGRGTFKAVMEGLHTLSEDPDIKANGLGALCVIDPEANGAQVYRFLADDTGLNGFNFLFPFMNWDNYDPEIVRGVSDFLVSAFHEWCLDLQAGHFRNVRVFMEALVTLRGQQASTEREDVRIGHDVIVIESNGVVMTEESLRPTYGGFFSELRIGETSIAEIHASPQFQQVERDTHTLSDECQGCSLLSACRSGASLGRVGMRYCSRETRLRKSVYCESFIALYVHAAAFLRVNRHRLPETSHSELEHIG